MEPARAGGSPESSAGAEAGPGAGEASHCPPVAAVLLQQRGGLRSQPHTGVSLGHRDGLGTPLGTRHAWALPACWPLVSPACRWAGSRAAPRRPAPAPCQRHASPPQQGPPAHPTLSTPLTKMGTLVPPTLLWVHLRWRQGAWDPHPTCTMDGEGEQGTPTPCAPWTERGSPRPPPLVHHGWRWSP